MDTNNRILIVDDNVAIHQDFRKILAPPQTAQFKQEEFARMEEILFAEPDRPKPRSQPMHYNLEFAFQAAEAYGMIDQAEEGLDPYAVLFTDVRMPPGFDGVRLVEKVLQRAPFTEIVIITAFTDYSWDDLNQKFGWTDRILILRKPFDTITIKQIVSTLTKKWELGYQTRKLTKEMSLHLQDLEKKVEERTSELRAAYSELQNFAYIVSHDMRSPLAGLQGFIRELKLDIQETFNLIDPIMGRLDGESMEQLLQIRDERIPEALDCMSISSSKMDRQIKAVLNLARLGHRTFRFENLCLKTLVESQLKTLAFLIEEGGVSVTLQDMPLVFTDALAMEQILGNLLSNAVKYLDPERPGRIEIFSEADGGDTIVHIRDNGRGIPKQHRQRIFRIFQRIAHPGVEGDGMGLTYVKTLLQRLGGDIWCNSEAGVGTTFSFRIPEWEGRDYSKRN
ncbi:MAG: ATP-binding protein [Acidobacteriota bacterium]|nr:ATP-binding protein [Acidobacteriota bacterium]